MPADFEAPKIWCVRLYKNDLIYQPVNLGILNQTFEFRDDVIEPIEFDHVDRFHQLSQFAFGKSFLVKPDEITFSLKKLLLLMHDMAMAWAQVVTQFSHIFQLDLSLVIQRVQTHQNLVR